MLSWPPPGSFATNSNQTISVWLKKSRLRVSGHFLGFCTSQLERKETLICCGQRHRAKPWAWLPKWVAEERVKFRS